MTGQLVGLWPIVRRGISSVTPFTYRDGITFLELLTAIKESVIEIVEWSGAINDRLEAVAAALDELNKTKADKSELKQLATAMEKSISELRAEMIQLISSATAGGTVTDPTTGNVASVETALGNVYDWSRVFADFARDGGTLTAGEYEARDMTAREIDLAPNGLILNTH